MIVAHGLRKRFGHLDAVRGVSFTLGPGEVVGFLGPNGAGKTTTIRMLAGCLRPTEGAATIDGHDPLTHPLMAKTRLGYLPEGNALYPEMRVEDYVGHRAAIFGVPRRERRAAVDRALERCWLRDVRRQRVGTLSKGYRQRVGLASALVHDPPALILDEPATGLDPSQIAETRRLLLDLADRRRAMLLSSHILAEVEKTCARVLVIAGGTIRADGAPSDIAARAGSGALLLEAHPPAGSAPETLLSALRAIDGAGDVRAEPAGDGWLRLRVEPRRRGADLREAGVRTVLGAGWSLREARIEAPTLEEAFSRLVAGEAPS